MYAALFPESLHPELTSFSRVVERFHETESVVYKNEESIKTVTKQIESIFIIPLSTAPG